jgi:hypothetical protein
MIPVNILMLLIIFVILYIIGAGLTVYTFIKSIRDKKNSIDYNFIYNNDILRCILFIFSIIVNKELYPY